ncbi:hypothetical protein AAFF_G00215500 [Aldrovandia affinis]|uniref:Uncharacterized protein n=1 Tax=Aldrovandia affinis TaxID=143900 RepID=A0AAD7RG58_9TELE|nr:hypothetical protein AAFF_G00215500 [Aldrovandia affinis]
MASHPRALRSRKRTFPGREESAPAGDTEALQQEEPHRSSVGKLTSNGLKESSALLSKDVKANDSCAEVTFHQMR